VQTTTQWCGLTTLNALTQAAQAENMLAMQAHSEGRDDVADLAISQVVDMLKLALKLVVKLD